MKTGFYIILFGFIFLALSCEETKSVDNCGNESIDTGEECDGEELGDTCESLGFYYGTLSCRDDCTLNLSQCSGECGDDILQSDRGEQCEPSTFSTVTCASVGLGGGMVSQCSNTCKYDLSDCTGECGDGTIQDVLNEECEFTDLNGESCETLGYYGGTLSCNSDICSYDLQDCESNGYCGDGIVQSQGDEVCDGTILVSLKCTLRGYLGGNNTCSDKCALNCLYFTRISSGEEHICAIDNFNRVWCWGSESHGALGLGDDATDMVPPKLVETDSTFIEVVTGLEHTCAIDSNNKLWCWGNNNARQLGVEYTTISSSFYPVRVDSDNNFKNISAGYNHTCAIDFDDKLWCWGSNMNGALGISGGNSSVLINVTPFNSFKEVSGGLYFTCAIDLTDKTWCWGTNNRGQLGNNDNTVSATSVPQEVYGGHTFKNLSSGSYHSCAMDINDKAWCWGWADDGAMGNGVSTGDFYIPVLVSGNISFAEISAKREHTCAIDMNGAAYCWGQYLYGILGIGAATENATTPQPVDSTENFTSISSGKQFTCALTQTKGYCWGRNDMAQLGNPNYQGDASVPRTIGELVEPLIQN
jgi:alpha-tubulin suppressor-like RCC1 family protein